MIRLHRVRRLGPGGLGPPVTVEIEAPVDQDLQAEGLIVSPGWVDLHTHLRNPGFPEKETLESGSRSAAAGGFTRVVAMANTSPATDTPALVQAQASRALTLPIRVSFVGALTVGLQGRVLTDARGLQQAGAVALSDDGRHATDRDTLRQGLLGAAAAGLPVLVHPQVEALGTGAEAEEQAVRGAIDALRDAPGARLHLQHVSTAAAVSLVRDAKRAGLAVTAEVTPHHLSLTRDELRRSGPLAKVNPPLRSAADVEALRTALVEGVIDAIATDHAPHESAVKRDLETAAFGIHGFETALAVVLGLGLPWEVVHRVCVASPLDIVGLAPADDWILIDPQAEWTVDPARFFSRGRNTPLAGRTLRGLVRMTVCRRRIVHSAEVLVA